MIKYNRKDKMSDKHHSKSTSLINLKIEQLTLNNSFNIPQENQTCISTASPNNLPVILQLFSINSSFVLMCLSLFGGKMVKSCHKERNSIFSFSIKPPSSLIHSTTFIAILTTKIIFQSPKGHHPTLPDSAPLTHDLQNIYVI